MEVLIRGVLTPLTLRAPSASRSLSACGLRLKILMYYCVHCVSVLENAAFSLTFNEFVSRACWFFIFQELT
jgi:hypothetical protein